MLSHNFHYAGKSLLLFWLIKFILTTCILEGCPLYFLLEFFFFCNLYHPIIFFTSKLSEITFFAVWTPVKLYRIASKRVHRCALDCNVPFNFSLKKNVLFPFVSCIQSVSIIVHISEYTIQIIRNITIQTSI